MQRYRLLIAINGVVVLVLCLFVVRFAGFHGSAGQASAGYGAAEVATAKEGTGMDATARARIDSAVPVVSADGVVVGTASAGSPNVILRFTDETVNATPFIRDFRPEDDVRKLVEEHKDVCRDAGELCDRATGQLRAVSITTQAVYEVEQLYLDAQHGRLFMKAINKCGETASWGHFSLSDRVTLDLEQTKRLRLITGDGVRRFFVLAAASESSEQ